MGKRLFNGNAIIHTIIFIIMALLTFYFWALKPFIDKFIINKETPATLSMSLYRENQETYDEARKRDAEREKLEEGGTNRWTYDLKKMDKYRLLVLAIKQFTDGILSDKKEKARQ